VKLQQVCQQIRDVINLLVREGLADHQIYPATTKVGQQTQVVIPGSPDLSVSLKGEPYTRIYDELRKAEAYHIRMIDGALIQMLYTFQGRKLISHRLAMFPSPLLEMYDAIPDDYDTDQWYSDIVGEFSVKFPVRFDYSASDKKYTDVEHPKCHLTLGQYEGCRIPSASPLTPLRFMRFILRNFYSPAYPPVNMDAISLRTKFDECISPNERKIFHVIG
jgi:hypothetical protein